MRASTPSVPRMDRRSEGTLDCHTGAILLREGTGAVASTYQRGSSAQPSALPGPSSVSASIGTPTTVSEPPPFAVARPPFPRGGVAIVLGPGPATVRAQARRSARPLTSRLVRPDHAVSLIVASGRSRWTLGLTCVGAFALGATTAASAGELANRAVEAAASACVIAGVLILLGALLRTSKPAQSSKHRAARRRD